MSPVELTLAGAEELRVRLLAAGTGHEAWEVGVHTAVAARMIRDEVAEHPERHDELLPVAMAFGLVAHAAGQKMEVLYEIERLRKYGHGPTPLERGLMMKRPINLDTALVAQAHVAAVAQRGSSRERRSSRRGVRVGSRGDPEPELPPPLGGPAHLPMAGA
jgi:hypothetical protein